MPIRNFDSEMKLHTDRLSPTQLLTLFCGIVLILLFALHYRLGAELADDGAFFLRYAENMLKGEFWVWNPGETPVWGASAPLYPLVLALPMALGMSPGAAIVGASMGLSALSFAAVTLMLGHRFGSATGLAFLAFSVLDTGMMYFCGSGLETPISIALLALALWTLLYRTNAWAVGIAAGLLMVNKLDLVPAGALLLLAHWFQDKRFPKFAVMLAAAIGVAWYGFAWWHFGAPVPNSFLTKSLHQNDFPSSITWTWFGGFLLLMGFHKWLGCFSAIALWRAGRGHLPVLILFGGLLLVHLAAYTLKYPFEPYNWYAMPALFALLIGGAVGLGAVTKTIARWFPRQSWVSNAVAMLAIAVLFGFSYQMEMHGTRAIKMAASHVEFDRAEAGRWVDANTPQHFVVLTWWGNPAYYSGRKVLDGSFLNRKFESGDLISKYRPEILILQGDPGNDPANPAFPAAQGAGYRVVKVFAKAYSAGMGYFFAVLAREDIMGQLLDVDPPRNLMAFARDVQLGDKIGTFKQQGLGTIYIHPGITTPTAFTFSAKEYLDGGSKQSLNLHVRIDPNIPADSIKRGAGNVHVRILQGSKELANDVVKWGQAVQRDLAPAGDEPLRIIVDNNGDSDTDWVLLSIH